MRAAAEGGPRGASGMAWPSPACLGSAAAWSAHWWHWSTTPAPRSPGPGSAGLRPPLRASPLQPAPSVRRRHSLRPHPALATLATSTPRRGGAAARHHQGPCGGAAGAPRRGTDSLLHCTPPERKTSGNNAPVGKCWPLFGSDRRRCRVAHERQLCSPCRAGPPTGTAGPPTPTKASGQQFCSFMRPAM